MAHNETMKFRNPTNHTLVLDAIGIDPVAPGEVVEIPLDLCAATRRDNGSRGKSALECVCPHLVPCSDADAKAWKQTPAPPTPVSKIVTVTARKQALEAPGVRALREQRERMTREAQAKEALQTAQSEAPPKAQG